MSWSKVWSSSLITFELDRDAISDHFCNASPATRDSDAKVDATMRLGKRILAESSVRNSERGISFDVDNWSGSECNEMPPRQITHKENCLLSLVNMGFFRLSLDLTKN